jgi:hypothetical protein
MTDPLDVIRAFHNAFRKDMAAIDTAALSVARGKPDALATLDRFRFFNEMLVWHADGEELAIFPALEPVAPSVAEAYIKDHRGLDTAYESLREAVSAQDTLATARASAAFKFHLDMHLGKEDTHLYRLVRERVPQPDQLKAIGTMAGIVPRERFPDVVAWLFPLLGADDRENTIRVWNMLMPAEVFAGVKPLIQKAVGDAGWAELNRNAPEPAA